MAPALVPGLPAIPPTRICRGRSGRSSITLFLMAPVHDRFRCRSCPRRAHNFSNRFRAQRERRCGKRRGHDHHLLHRRRGRPFVFRSPRAVVLGLSAQRPPRTIAWPGFSDSAFDLSQYRKQALGRALDSNHRFPERAGRIFRGNMPGVSIGAERGGLVTDDGTAFRRSRPADKLVRRSISTSPLKSCASYNGFARTKPPGDGSGVFRLTALLA